MIVYTEKNKKHHRDSGILLFTSVGEKTITYYIIIILYLAKYSLVYMYFNMYKLKVKF